MSTQAKSLIAFVSCILVLLIGLGTQNVFADTIFINVQLSKSCKASTNCPTYFELAKMVDNTDPKISGKYYEENKKFIRDKPAYKNHYDIYKQKNIPIVIMVEPDPEFAKRSKTIMIEPPVKMTWIDRKDSKVINNTRYQYNDIFIDDCFNVRLAWNEKLFLDAVYHISTGCKNLPSDYNKETIQKEPTKINFCGNDCQHKKWLKEVKAKYKTELRIGKD